MKIFLSIVFILLAVFGLRAQQDPLYAQYFNNPLLINPAFAGSNERLFAGLAYRTQWSGLEGSPVTYNVNVHTSLMDNRVGAGIVLVQDKIGEFKTTQYGGAFSYRIKLKQSTFSFGMQAGMVQYATNANDIQSLNPDPLFVPFSNTEFNAGAGVLLKSDRYAVGVSVPHFLANTVVQGDQEVQLYGQNFYIYGTYLFNLNERLAFKPSSLLRMTQGSPLSADVNLNMVINSLYTAGVFTRNMNTYGMLLQLVIKNARVSYVFELPGKGSSLNFNTHEVGVALSLDVLSSHNHINNGF
jgi:type IX secretion system PorP/SprF family membrane protein